MTYLDLILLAAAVGLGLELRRTRRDLKAALSAHGEAMDAYGRERGQRIDAERDLRIVSFTVGRLTEISGAWQQDHTRRTGQVLVFPPQHRPEQGVTLDEMLAEMEGM